MNEKPKILIADDSEINRALLKEILGDGYDYLEAEDGAAAVELMRQRTDISLLLLDLMMPGMDGFDVLRVMKYHAWLDEIPVIVISAAEDTANIERAYDLGVADYIRRPFERIMIIRRVKNILMLYAKQKRLTRLVTDQVYEKEHNSVLMISILSHVVEFRNSESGLHVMHIRTLTDLLLHRLAQKTDRYQLDESDIARISTASALHDIGKIVIPEEILNKPGRLTAEEFAVIKNHTVAGAQMLQDLGQAIAQDEPLLQVAHAICRWHHERWDGNGYPDRLKGDEIPIAAQVVALADVYDALTSERCYKHAYDHDTALRMILNGECGAFNPLLLDCLRESSEQLRTELARSEWDRGFRQETHRLSEEILHREALPRENHSQLLLDRCNGMERSAFVDPLTGAYTRRYFDKFLAGGEMHGGVAMIDVNQFKSVNDSFGHLVGDEALQTVAAAMQSCLRQTDILIRYGGDEFLLLMPQNCPDGVESVIRRVQNAVQAARVPSHPELWLSVSIGGVCNVQPLTEAIRQADARMYCNKENGESVL